MSTLMEIREKQQEVIHQARECLDQITDDIDESRAQELEQQYDKWMAEYDKLEERAQRASKIEEAEQRLFDSRPPEPNVGAHREERERRSYAEIFGDYLRRGREGLTADEIAELRAGDEEGQYTGSDAAGGYLVPTEFQNELMETLKMYGPMLDPGATRQITTATGADLEWPTLDDTSNKGRILGEAKQANHDEDLSFGQKILKAYKYTSDVIRVSEEMLQDSALNIESIVQEAMAERLGRIVNEHLTVGDGSEKPEGIVTAANAGTTASATDSIDPADLLDLQHAVDPAYRNRNRVQWMLNDGTLKAIRKLKDADDRYLWQPADMRTGEPANLLGFPYVVNQDMPDMSSGNKAILFGDFNRYVVRVVAQWQVRRLTERYADFFQVGFIGMGRFGGKLIDSDAVKALEMGT